MSDHQQPPPLPENGTSDDVDSNCVIRGNQHMSPVNPGNAFIYYLSIPTSDQRHPTNNIPAEAASSDTDIDSSSGRNQDDSAMKLCITEKSSISGPYQWNMNSSVNPTGAHDTHNGVPFQKHDDSMNQPPSRPFDSDDQFHRRSEINNPAPVHTLDMIDLTEEVSLKLDDFEMLFVNGHIVGDCDIAAALQNEEDRMEAQNWSDDVTAIAHAAPPPPSSSSPDADGTNVHENDIWICKTTYEDERRRDIALWLRTICPQNPQCAFFPGDLAGLQEQLDKLSILKKLTLLLAFGELYLVEKNEAIMDTKNTLRGADISIASLFNHGKRIVVEFEGHHQDFDKLQEFLFPPNLFYFSWCTHNVFFCPIQHHLKESDLTSFCKRMDFAYGGLGEAHRKDACTNTVKSRTDVGDLFRIIANGERRCLKSGDKVSNMQHGHFLVRVAAKAAQGRFHGFLFGIENSRPWKSLKDGYNSLKRDPTVGMFDTGHGPAATKGPASVSGGLKRDQFMELIGRNPDNMGGIRLHLDKNQVDAFYSVYASIANKREKYEELLNSPIGTVPHV